MNLLTRAICKELDTRADGNLGIISGHILKFGDVDSYNTRFLKGCALNTIKERFTNSKKIKILWNHKRSELPVGVLLDIREDDVGVYFEAKLELDNDFSADLFRCCKNGSVNTMSFGFAPISEREVKGIIEYSEIHIAEISPVNFAANEKSQITDVRNEMNSEDKKEIKTRANTVAETFKIDELYSKGWDILRALMNTVDDINWNHGYHHEDHKTLIINAFDDVKKMYMEFYEEYEEHFCSGHERSLSENPNEIQVRFIEFLEEKKIDTNSLCLSSNMTIEDCKKIRNGEILSKSKMENLPDEIKEISVKNERNKIEELITFFENYAEEADFDRLKSIADVRNKETETEVISEEKTREEGFNALNFLNNLTKINNKESK